MLLRRRELYYPLVDQDKFVNENEIVCPSSKKWFNFLISHFITLYLLVNVFTWRWGHVIKFINMKWTSWFASQLLQITLFSLPWSGTSYRVCISWKKKIIEKKSTWKLTEIFFFFKLCMTHSPHVVDGFYFLFFLLCNSTKWYSISELHQCAYFVRFIEIRFHTLLPYCIAVTFNVLAFV